MNKKLIYANFNLVVLNLYLIWALTPGSMSLLDCELYQRGRLSRVADTELILHIALLIRPQGSIPGAGWVKNIPKSFKVQCCAVCMKLRSENNLQSQEKPSKNDIYPCWKDVMGLWEDGREGGEGGRGGRAGLVGGSIPSSLVMTANELLPRARIYPLLIVVIRAHLIRGKSIISFIQMLCYYFGWEIYRHNYCTMLN